MAAAIAEGIKRAVLRRLPDPWIRRLKKIHYLRQLRRQGPDEEKDFAVIARLVKPGDRVVDVGANYGVYMKFLSGLVGEKGKVFCAEPVPGTCEILVANARALGLRNVEILDCAFSDRAGEAMMEIPRLPGGGENYYMARIVDGGGDGDLRRVPIRVETLDGRFLQGGEISFVKCDVEGHELSCLRGALGVIRKWAPSFCVEISGDPDAPGSAREVFELFATEGYGAYWYDGRALRKREPGDSSVNYFFLRPDHLERASAPA